MQSEKRLCNFNTRVNISFFFVIRTNKVVCLCAKSREHIASHVDFLALHNLVEEIALVEENKLHKMKGEVVKNIK